MNPVRDRTVFALGRVLNIALVMLLAGCAAPVETNETLDEQLDRIFAAQRGQPGYAVFKRALMNDYRHYQAWKPLGYKVFVIAGDVGGGFVSAMGYGSNSASVGRNFALRRCKEKRDVAAIEAACVEFARGDRIILDS